MENIHTNKLRFFEENNTYSQKVNENKILIEKLLNYQKVKYIKKFQKEVHKKNIYPILQKKV